MRCPARCSHAAEPDSTTSLVTYARAIHDDHDEHEDVLIRFVIIVAIVLLVSAVSPYCTLM